MAEKRQIRVEKASTPQPSEEIPQKFKEEGWREWFTGYYAKWWYVLLCMAVDVFLALETSRYLSGSWAYFVPLMLVLVAIMLEIYIFHRLWGGLDFLFGNRRLI